MKINFVFTRLGVAYFRQMSHSGGLVPVNGKEMKMISSGELRIDPEIIENQKVDG